MDVSVENLGALRQLARELFVVARDHRLGPLEDVVHGRQSTSSEVAAPTLDRGRLALDGQFWRLSPGWSATLLAIPFAGAALVALASLRPGLYNALVREDSVLECLQVAGYVAAVGLSAVVALRLERARRRPLAVLFGLLALGCLFAAGEEVSWGQRLFGFGTPDEVAAVNNQDELNLHDVVEVQGKFNLLLALASLYGLASPWLVRRRALVVPPLALGSAFLAMFTYTTSRALFFPHPHHELAKYSEWPETCFAGALAVFGFLALRLVREDPSA